MIKSTASYINSALINPSRFPLGRFGIISTACLSATAGPLLISSGIISVANIARALFGEVIGSLTLAGLVGSFAASVAHLYSELDK